MTEQVTLANWKTIVATMKSDFALAHKYKIAGKLDLTFEFTAKAINNDSTFEALKRTRVDAAINIHRIAISSDPDDSKQKQTGFAKIAFLQRALRDLQGVSQKGKAADIVKAANYLATELSAAVTSYTTGMATLQDAAKDANFIATARKIMDGLKSLISTEAPRLRAANILYSVDSVKGLRTLATVKTVLDAA
ncbi:MAG: hypothetical protein EPN97_07120 [Alphaproteobacteria bacterium]|nr:MAG: hypothetical protein EPN97_07120 [Alphaproteobacteria bacterium]